MGECTTKIVLKQEDNVVIYKVPQTPFVVTLADRDSTQALITKQSNSYNQYLITYLGNGVTYVDGSYSEEQILDFITRGVWTPKSSEITISNLTYKEQRIWQ